MHRLWYGLGVAAAAAFLLAGCATSEPSKVPKHAEEFTSPPSEDPRYSQPPAYPKNVLNPDRIPIAGDAGGPGGPKAGGMGGPSRQ